MSAPFHFAPTNVAIHALGDPWVTNATAQSESFSGSVTEFAPDGAVIDTSFDPRGSSALAIDPAGDIWVANAFGAAVSNPFQSTVTELKSDGALICNFTNSSLDIAGALAIDAAGNVWLTNLMAALTELNSAGSLTGNFNPPGAAFNNPGPVAIDASGNVWVANIAEEAPPSPIAEIIGAARPVLRLRSHALPRQFRTPSVYPESRSI